MAEQNPFCSCVGQVMRKNLSFVHQDEKVKQVFTLAFLVFFRSARTFQRFIQ